MMPTLSRNLPGCYFSSDAYASLPAYHAATPELREKAKHILAQMRNSGLSADSPPVISDDRLLDAMVPPLHKRIYGFAQRIISRPDLLEREFFSARVQGLHPSAYSTVHILRRLRSAKEFDIGKIDDLPNKFIYYPLQKTPEASINTPAPYFVDQFRAIDAIRMSMPNGYTLVVKEHWVGIDVRPTSEMKILRRLPGVLVANYRLSSIDIIKKAALTMTVTGTAGFEGFLLGRPTLMLGKGIVAWCLGQIGRVGTLTEQIASTINNPVPDDIVIERIAEMLSVTYPFYYRSTGEQGEHVLRSENIEYMADAFVDHLQREAAHDGLVSGEMG